MAEFLKKLKNKIRPSTADKSETMAHLPENGPVNEDGKEVLLSVKNVDITFGKGDKAVKAVKNASFDIYKGETFSLVGESGSGKTTIGRAVIRVNPCAAGEILYKGVRISGKIPHSLDREVIRNVQMVFQDPAASLNERATVDYIVSEGLYNFHLFKNEAERVQKVETMIEEVGLLPEHLTRYPHEFSGGQRQRIGLARAMIMEPELVVADEPISALDVSIRAQVLNLLKKFQKERGVTYLFIAHDLSIVRFISDRIGVIYKGDIVEVAEAEELFNFPLHPYTRSLISAIPIPDPQLEKNKELFTYDPSVHDAARLAAEEKAKAEAEEEAKRLAEQAAQAQGEAEQVEEKKKSGIAVFWDKVKGAFAKLFKRFKKSDGQENKLNVEKPCLTDIGHGHFVFGYQSEIEEYKKVREAGVPVKSVTILNPKDKKETKKEKQETKQESEKKTAPAKESILDRPVHDTGSVWYKLLSFFLPLVGLVLLFVFKAKNYIRNYKACKKGTIIGFSVIGAIIVLFCFFLILAVI